jgi:hypothetical protein
MEKRVPVPSIRTSLEDFNLSFGDDIGWRVNLGREIYDLNAFLSSNAGRIVFVNIIFKPGALVLLRDGYDSFHPEGIDERIFNHYANNYASSDLKLDYSLVYLKINLFNQNHDKEKYSVTKYSFTLENYNEEERVKNKLPCDSASSCNVSGFYVVTRANGNDVTLRHVSYEKVLLNPKYDPP